MANFPGHLKGALVAGAAATLITPFYSDSLYLAPIAGISAFMGGLLPDIDGENTIPRRFFYWATLSLAIVMGGLSHYPFFALINPIAVHFAWRVADAIMRHRGYVHSLFGGACLSYGVAGIAVLLGTENEKTSEIIALATFLGFCLHLLMDEYVSVRWSRVLNPLFWRNKGKKSAVKRSFRTAFVLIGTGSKIELAMVSAIGFLGANSVYGIINYAN